MKDDQRSLTTSDLDRLGELFGCGIFERENAGHTLFRSAVVEMIICLHESLQTAAKENVRINFVDDVLIRPDVADVTDAVRMIRDACCHTASGRSHVNSPLTRALFFVILRGGLGHASANISGFAYVNDYADDIAIFFGKNRLYLTRHALRAYLEARTALEPLLR
jgi:hypothetical protein